MTQIDGTEDRLVRLLAAEGLINRSRRASMRPLPLAAFAAMLAAGFCLGAFWARPPDLPPSHGERYALLLYEGSSYRPAAPGRSPERAAEYGAWARAPHPEGRVISGEELQSQAGVLGPPAPAQVQPAGFFVVETPDRDAALRLAGTCPHIRYGGTVVIRALSGGDAEHIAAAGRSSAMVGRNREEPAWPLLLGS